MNQTKNNNNNDDKPRCGIGKDVLEVYPAIGQHTFQRHGDQRTSEETVQLINRIFISVLLIL